MLSDQAATKPAAGFADPRAGISDESTTRESAADESAEKATRDAQLATRYSEDEGSLDTGRSPRGDVMHRDDDAESSESTSTQVSHARLPQDHELLHQLGRIVRFWRCICWASRHRYNISTTCPTCR